MILVTGAQEIINDFQNTEPEEVVSYFQQLLPKIIAFGQKVLIALIIFLISVKVINTIRKIVKRSFTRTNAEVGVIQFVDSFMKAILYIILAVFLAGYFGVQTASLVALLGSIGLAIGMALQGSLSNFAGGVLILLMKPFKVGDYIEDTNKNAGTVMEIQLFYTKLNTIDNSVVVIPNGTLANSSLINFTGQNKRRITILVGISYHTDILKAKAVLQQLINEEEAVLGDEEALVFVEELADSCIKIGLRCWVKTEDFVPTKWRLTENIKLAFDKVQIEIPFNQLDVTIKNKQTN